MEEIEQVCEILEILTEKQNTLITVEMLPLIDEYIEYMTASLNF